MKSKFTLLVAALSVMGLSGCRGLQNFFHGAPCATCSSVAAPGYLADCGPGCGMEGPVVSGMVGDMGGEVMAPWGGGEYLGGYPTGGGYPSGGTVVPPSSVPSTMAPLNGQTIVPPAVGR